MRQRRSLRARSLGSWTNALRSSARARRSPATASLTCLRSAIWRPPCPDASRPNPSAAAVDRDRHPVEENLVGRIRKLALEPLDDLRGARRSGVETRDDVLHRLQLHELLLELPRETAAPEVPAVELLQKSCSALRAELALGLADEQDQLRRNLLARRVLRATVDDLAQRPRVPLRAPPDHHRGGTGRRQHRLGASAGRDV